MRSDMDVDDQAIITITVVIPAYNAGQFLAATLQSIQSQGTEGVQVVLVDGGSNDCTLEVAKAFSELDIKVVCEADEGQLDALQKGLGLVDGEIILWLNADDIVMPGAFAAVRKAFRDKSVEFVYSDNVAFREETRSYYYGASIRGLTDLDHFLFYRQMYSECVYWRRSITKYLPASAFSLRVYTDYAFFLRMRWGRRGLWLPCRLGAFRIREGQSSEKYSAKKAREYAMVKTMHREYISWTTCRYVIAKMLYWPWFFGRQYIAPQTQRAVRRVVRLCVLDKYRIEESRRFYEMWLLPSDSKGPRSHD